MVLPWWVWRCICGCHYPAIAVFDANVTGTAGGEPAVKQRLAKATNTLSHLKFVHVAVSVAC